MGQIEDFKLFVSVVDSRSISRAAEKLNIAKSAVSRRLNLLEQRYGARFINRAPGMWEITTTGREFYQRAVRIVNDVEDEFVSRQRKDGTISRDSYFYGTKEQKIS